MPIEILKKLPKKAAAMWESVYAAAKPKYGEERAAKIAWESVKKKFKKVENKWVARSDDFDSFVTTSFQFIPEQVGIERTTDGGAEIEYVLATDKSINNISLSEVALKRMAEQINEEGVVGNISDEGTHSLLNELRAKGLSEQEIEEEIQKRNSGLKAVKASVKNGKLYAKIHVSKELFAKANGFRAASIEARIPADAIRGGVTNQARLIGFVLTNTPSDEAAIRVS